MHHSINSKQDRSKQHKRLLKGFWRVVLLSAVFLGLAQFALQYLDHEQTSLITIESETGEVVWSVPLSDSKLLARFTTAQADRVLVGMATDFDEFSHRYEHYEIQAFSTASGQKLWTFIPKLSKPYRAEDMAFRFPPYAQGETLWLNLLLESAPKRTVGDPKIATEQSDQQVAPLPNIRNGQVIAIDTATGQPQWTVDRDWSIYFLDHIGLASSGDRNVILRITPTQKVWLEAYQTSTGKKIWQTQLAAFSRLVETPSYLYRAYRLIANPDVLFLFSAYSKTIKGYDWETGKLKFEIKAEIPSLEMAASDSTLYNHSYTRVAAFDSRTGIRRWAVDLAGSNPSKCQFISDVATVADGIYVVCQGSQNFRSEVKLLFLDAQTGHKQWFKTISNTVYENGISLGSKSFIAWIAKMSVEPGAGLRLATFIRGRDRELWNWKPEYEVQPQSISAGDNRVFLLGEVSRWQNLKSRFNNRLR